METIDTLKKQFLYYKTIGEKAMKQIPEAALFSIPTPESNSIAIIVQHLAGNMKSRFTDFLESDGEKPWRNRDAEFESKITSTSELWDAWNQGWDVFFNTLNSLSNADLQRMVYIRNEGHTVQEALLRQLAHYPYHIGQIVFLAKMLVSHSWQTLSIAKNASKSFNDEKFEREKSIKHFTDSEIEKHKKNEN
jgi:hypothetical protein